MFNELIDWLPFSWFSLHVYCLIIDSNICYVAWKICFQVGWSEVLHDPGPGIWVLAGRDGAWITREDSICHLLRSFRIPEAIYAM